MAKLKTLQDLIYRIKDDPSKPGYFLQIYAIDKDLKKNAVESIKIINECYSFKKDGSKSYSSEKINKFFEDNPGFFPEGYFSYDTKIKILETIKSTYMKFFNLTEKDFE